MCVCSATDESEQCSGPSELPEDDDFSLVSDAEEMDLLGEIFDTLSAQSSREPGLLYSTRSLDVFGSDSSDFISRVRPFNNHILKPQKKQHALTAYISLAAESGGTQSGESKSFHRKWRKSHELGGGARGPGGV